MLMVSELILTENLSKHRRFWLKCYNLPHSVFIAVRAITNSNYVAHSTPLFSDLKILDIFKISALQTAKFMFSHYHQNLPSVLSNLFITSDQVHGYNTRNAHRFRSHPCWP